MSDEYQTAPVGRRAGPVGPAPVVVRAATGSVRDDARDFSAVLGRQDTGVVAGRPGRAKTAHAKAREAAEEFVAVALVQPILTQAREESMAAEPFSRSSAERQFRALQDATLAQRITRAAHFPLVDRLAHDLLKR